MQPGVIIMLSVEDLRQLIREEVERLQPAVALPPAPAAEDAYVTYQRAAEIASVHPATVRTWVRRGDLLRYSAGTDPRVRLSELHAYLAREQRQDGVEPIDFAARARELRGRPRQGRGA